MSNVGEFARRVSVGRVRLFEILSQGICRFAYCFCSGIVVGIVGNLEEETMNRCPFFRIDKVGVSR